MTINTTCHCKRQAFQNWDAYVNKRTDSRRCARFLGSVVVLATQLWAADKPPAGLGCTAEGRYVTCIAAIPGEEVF